MILKKHLLFNVFVKSLRINNTNLNIRSLNQVRYSSSFHKWTLDYFRNQPNYNKFVLKKSAIESDEPVNDSVQLKTISTDKLIVKLLCKNLKISLGDIDNELKNRIDHNLSINQMLALMDTCLSENLQLHKTSQSFKKCIEVMDELWFRRPDLTASQTLQLIYYVSVYKNQSKSIAQYGLQKLMNEINYLKQLTNEELSVLAVATYKCSAKVNDKILKIFANRFENNIEKLIQNPLQFVSLIKPLKKAKYHDPVLINRLIFVLSNSKDNNVFKDITSSIHLLSFLADANCGNVEFLQTITDSVGNKMIKDTLKSYRIKDVSSYIFSVSYLGLSPKDSYVCKMIIDFLDQIFDTKEKCKKRSKMLIGMCLSMWMLNHKPIKLLKYLFSEVSIATLRMPNAHKQDNRLNLLLTCAFIEQPDLIMRCQLVEKSSNTMPEVYTHLGERPFLVKVFQALQELSHTFNISNIEYHFNIPHLKILGIKVLKNNSKVINIEVLDNCTCLYGTQIPNGMMKLKFRLESKLNLNVITVNYKDNAINSSMLLIRYLESALSQT